MNIQLLRRQLLKWFYKHQRSHYPWRHTANPFHILIAETLLQRTRADQVEPIYLRFLDTYPAPSHLASANENDICELIHPLGLAWRGKNLKQTAIDIQEKFHGKIPSKRNELLQIKGIGEYIADCILYQVFKKRRSIIDSNVIRIIGRLYGLEFNAESRRKKIFRKLADDLLPPRAFRNFNLALLDLGALVCNRTPTCKKCPINTHCNYFKELEK